MSTFVWLIIIPIVLGALSGALKPSKKRRKGTKPKSRRRNQSPSGQAASRRTSMQCRGDDIILTSRLDDLSGPEFERLLALYFRDQGYSVKEVGVGGNDGGVDLVIIDSRGEKTAVQAKCYADHNNVTVQVVRELVAAKRNHDCILSLLVTTSDLTPPAKKEAEQFKVDYWHGALLEQKLRAWGKWQPSKKLRPQGNQRVAKEEVSNVRKEVPAASQMSCKCGAIMVRRKSKQGMEFWGCTNFPACRFTRTL